MIKPSLRNRLIGTYLILVSLGVGGMVLRFGLLEQSRLISEAERKLALQAVILASALEEKLENHLEWVHRFSPGVHVLVSERVASTCKSGKNQNAFL